MIKMKYLVYCVMMLAFTLGACAQNTGHDHSDPEHKHEHHDHDGHDHSGHDHSHHDHDHSEPSKAELEARQKAADEAAAAQLATDIALIEAHLKDNKIKKAEKTESGLHYKVNKKGNGTRPQPGDYVAVHYTGKTLDGNVFDSSIDRGEPIAFQIGKGRVIKGWDEGIALFDQGGSGTLFIPSGIAYGSREIPNLIPANSVLVFDVELVEIMDQEGYTAWQQKMRTEREAKQAEMAEQQMLVDNEVIENYVKEKGLKVQSTASGLRYIVENQGDGPRAEAGKNVTVHYRGTLLDGTQFDASYDRGQPFTFPLGKGRVIKGWDEGIALFNVGGKGTLIIPSPLAYGARAQGQIPANAVLIFEIEVVDVK